MLETLKLISLLDYFSKVEFGQVVSLRKGNDRNEVKFLKLNLFDLRVFLGFSWFSCSRGCKSSP